MTLAELVVVRDAVIAAQAGTMLVQGSLEREDVRQARVRIGYVDDELARAAEALTEAIDNQRNGSGS